MSANNEFPVESFPPEDLDYDGYPYPFYDRAEVQDWFKRCIEDFPEQRDSTFMEEDIWAYNHWFEKWFSQFRNKCQK